ncbi:MAG: TlpA family protein disulfide reductase [Saprospiraceae bacterium]|jgi:peroxiredoxin|nr:TlpA family protein disulfide reductase [Saprospiraceae bacterium]
MRVVQYLCILAILCVATTTASAQKQVPDVEVKTLEGATVNLKDYAKNGKITVISLWATWCSPCKKELDAIAEIYPDWVEEYDMELVAITIDTRRALAKVKPMVQTKGWEYIVLSDANNQLRNALNFQTIPQTYLIDQNGEIVYTHSGYVPGDEYELEDKIKALTKK